MIYCEETGKVYKSSIEASKDTGIEASNIRRAVQGKRATAGGVHWHKGEPSNLNKLTRSPDLLARFFALSIPCNTCPLRDWCREVRGKDGKCTDVWNKWFNDPYVPGDLIDEVKRHLTKEDSE